MRRVPTQLGVYGPNTPFSSPAEEAVSYDEGRRRVDNGEAAFINRGSAIRMFTPATASNGLPLERPPFLQGRSCRPGPELTVAAAIYRSHSALQIVEAWKRKFV